MALPGRASGVLLGDWAAAAYGTLSVGTLLAVETPSAENYWETLVGALIALLVYWLAHAYAGLLGERMQSGARLSPTEVLVAMRHEAPILLGAAPSLTALVVCWIGGADLSVAVSIAVWTSAAVIVLIECVAGLRAHLTGRQLLLQVSVGALLGLLILVLRLVLHH